MIDLIFLHISSILSITQQYWPCFTSLLINVKSIYNNTNLIKAVWDHTIVLKLQNILWDVVNSVILDREEKPSKPQNMCFTALHGKIWVKHSVQPFRHHLIHHLRQMQMDFLLKNTYIMTSILIKIVTLAILEQIKGRHWHIVDKLFPSWQY